MNGVQSFVFPVNFHHIWKLFTYHTLASKALEFVGSVFLVESTKKETVSYLAFLKYKMKRDVDTENRLVDTLRVGEGGIN